MSAEFYVNVRLDDLTLLVLVVPTETVSVFKLRLVEVVTRTLGTAPGAFELRTDTRRDIVLRDSELTDNVVKYSYVTPLIHMLLINAHGDVAPLYERPPVQPLPMTANEIKEIKTKNQAAIAEYYQFL